MTRRHRILPWAVPAFFLQGIAMAFRAGLMGQWMLMQLLLWPLAIRYGLRVRYLEDGEATPDHRERQFSVRDLMVTTGIVGILFGAGRGVLGWLGTSYCFIDTSKPRNLDTRVVACLHSVSTFARTVALCDRTDSPLQQAAGLQEHLCLPICTAPLSPSLLTRLRATRPAYSDRSACRPPSPLSRGV
jgi:hypothetical protein